MLLLMDFNGMVSLITVVISTVVQQIEKCNIFLQKQKPVAKISHTVQFETLLLIVKMEKCKIFKQKPSDPLPIQLNLNGQLKKLRFWPGLRMPSISQFKLYRSHLFCCLLPLYQSAVLHKTTYLQIPCKTVCRMVNNNFANFSLTPSLYTLTVLLLKISLL